MTQPLHLEIVDSRTCDIAEEWPNLSPSEHDVSRRFRSSVHQACYIVAHSRLRKMLAACIQCDPANVRVVRAHCPRCGRPGGRPHLDIEPIPIHFSLSHSDWLAAVVVADSPVGIDVQHVRSGLRGLAGQLHPAEQAQIGESDSRLARCWTRKEAVLKAVGVGVAHGVRHPYVGAGGPPIQPPGFRLTDLAVPAGFSCAMALVTTSES